MRLASSNGLPNPMKNPRLFLILIVTATAFSPARAEPEVFRTVLRKSGDEGVHTYRIPGLAVTEKGTLVAVFDLRHTGGGDLPGDIDVGCLRSTDRGEAWGPMSRILDYPAAEPGARGNGVGDPAILIDRETGDIFVAALWSKGNRGWHGSGPGLSPDETGQLVIARSRDDGLTWSEPVSITPQIKDPAWRLCFQGPGTGISLRDGTLVFPAQFKDATNVPHACFIMSADHGETWTISPPAIPGAPPTSEAQIAEAGDGSLLLSMRDESRSGQRVWARWSRDGDGMKGKWRAPWHDLPDPTCMAGLVRHPTGALLFSNPKSAKARVGLTVRASPDDGKTWSEGRLLDAGSSAYSCLAVWPDGEIGLLYEAGAGLVFARFSLAWVLGK